jgi:hypothetical protein
MLLPVTSFLGRIRLVVRGGESNALSRFGQTAPGGGSQLANLHLTLIQKVFGSPATTFGNLTSPASTGILPGILA